jgi:glyoxylate carboligase
MQQIQMAQNTAKVAWDLHVHSVELQMQQQYQRNMQIKDHWNDVFSSPTRLMDVASMTFANGTAYATYAGLASASTVTVGGVVYVVVTVACAAYSTLRYYDIIPEISWEDLVS